MNVLVASPRSSGGGVLVTGCAGRLQTPAAERGGRVAASLFDSARSDSGILGSAAGVWSRPAWWRGARRWGLGLAPLRLGADGVHAWGGAVACWKADRLRLPRTKVARLRPTWAGPGAQPEKARGSFMRAAKPQLPESFGSPWSGSPATLPTRLAARMNDPGADRNHRARPGAVLVQASNTVREESEHG